MPGAGEPDGAHALVVVARPDVDEALVLEPAQQAAEVAGVEGEPTAQRPAVGAPGRHLPQQSGGAERPATGQVLLVERADPLGHGAVEAAYDGDRLAVHFV